MNKIALVIGVSNYKHANILNSPVNDAIDIGDSLSAVGFEVLRLEDPSFRKMSEMIDTFGNRIMGSDVCLFYYSGHGVEYEGTNYLIPADFLLQSPSDLAFGAYNVNKLLAKMDYAKVKTNIVILDACRNDPFKSILKDFTPHGLAAPNYPVKGTFIGFAAQPGKTALDGITRNSIYTRAILKYLNEPNLSIDVMFTRINNDVREMTNDAQVPFKNSSLSGQFYFIKSGPDINNFTQSEFDRRVDTLVEAKLRQREGEALKKEKGEIIQKLTNPYESVVAAAISSLLVESPENFTANEVLLICKAYQKYISKDTRIMDQADMDFKTLLDSIAVYKIFTDDETKQFIELYEQLPEYSDVAEISLQIISKNQSQFVTDWYKHKFIQSNPNENAGQYFGRFLLKENIQPFAFYSNYFEKINKKSSLLKQNFDLMIQFFKASNSYKSEVINWMNDSSLMDSVFLHGGINYEDDFFSYRSQVRSILSGWIQNSELDKTFFFSTLCPCGLGTASFRIPRKYPCRKI